MMSEAQDTKLKRGYFQDYHAPSIYLITVMVVDREPLLGGVVSNTEYAYGGRRGIEWDGGSNCKLFQG